MMMQGFGNTLSTVFVVLAHVLWPYVFSYSGWTPAYVHPATFTVISVTVHLALTGPAIGVKFVKVS